MKNENDDSASSAPSNGNDPIYRDFANITEGAIPALNRKFGSPTEGKKDLNFPVRLHYMLNDMEQEGQDQIISWQPHGRCFSVHDQVRLEKEALPMWFRQTKYASFQRQLNIYGFTRISDGADRGCYYHEMFLRGKQFLAQYILRKKGKRILHQNIDLGVLPPLPPTKIPKPRMSLSAGTTRQQVRRVMVVPMSPCQQVMMSPPSPWEGPRVARAPNLSLGYNSARYIPMPAATHPQVVLPNSNTNGRHFLVPSSPSRHVSVIRHHSELERPRRVSIDLNPLPNPHGVPLSFPSQRGLYSGLALRPNPKGVMRNLSQQAAPQGANRCLVIMNPNSAGEW